MTDATPAQRLPGHFCMPLAAHRLEEGFEPAQIPMNQVKDVARIQR
jgi:hypothetical protein